MEIALQDIIALQDPHLQLKLFAHLGISAFIFLINLIGITVELVPLHLLLAQPVHLIRSLVVHHLLLAMANAPLVITVHLAQIMESHLYVQLDFIALQALVIIYCFHVQLESLATKLAK